MNRTNPLVKSLLFGAIATIAMVLLSGVGPVLAAQGETRTLKDRIKSVSNRLYSKDGRLELTLYPLTSISLNDSFYQKFGGGLGLGYHFSESFSLQLMGTYSLNLETDYASYYGSKDTGDIPYAGKRTWLAGLDVCWAPVYGKISLAAEAILHFDTYLMLGVGAIGGEQKEDDSSTGFAGSIGVGIRVFMSRMFALKIELKDYLAYDTVTYPNKDFKENDVQHQLLLNIGVSLFFFGTEPEQEE